MQRDGIRLVGRSARLCPDKENATGARHRFVAHCVNRPLPEQALNRVQLNSRCALCGLSVLETAVRCHVQAIEHELEAATRNEET